MPDHFATLRAEVVMIEFRKEPDRIFATDETGKLLAEVTFPEQEGVAVINHTFVDGSLRGQGIAGQLLRAVADTLRQDGCKAKATCSYAVHWFETHPEEQDLLEP
ncbi:MAG TPA: N-acetyltransferase [Subdoligranulum variabile]|uniref:N-acetyltransferase n=1 Tax=Subdoligranulum variabile TaxID=214851 RepID=A0A921IIP0_9FIRM|nr:N-acetyltransferase [Subdoligranulum variabile]